MTSAHEGARRRTLAYRPRGAGGRTPLGARRAIRRWIVLLAGPCAVRRERVGQRGEAPREGDGMRDGIEARSASEAFFGGRPKASLELRAWLPLALLAAPVLLAARQADAPAFPAFKSQEIEKGLDVGYAVLLVD